METLIDTLKQNGIEVLNQNDISNGLFIGTRHSELPINRNRTNFRNLIPFHLRSEGDTILRCIEFCAEEQERNLTMCIEGLLSKEQLETETRQNLRTIQNAEFLLNRVAMSGRITHFRGIDERRRQFMREVTDDFTLIKNDLEEFNKIHRRYGEHVEQMKTKSGLFNSLFQKDKANLHDPLNIADHQKTIDDYLADMTAFENGTNNIENLAGDNRYPIVVGGAFHALHVNMAAVFLGDSRIVAELNRDRRLAIAPPIPNE